MTVDYTKGPTPPTPPPMMAGQPAQPQKKSGCWKWGLLGCGLILLICVLFVVGIAVFVFGVIKSTYVYKDSVHRAETNPQVIAALGSPIGTGFLVSGHIDTKNSVGTADIKIPIQGPKDKGTIIIRATMTDNNWRYEELTVKPDHGPPIDLLATEPLPVQNP
ncbi:MAG TPA: cytochrome c oxidase assembly factor Coa1 family protein [Thermoanaerobaculia bacterium]|nr:cytochrome c oxidase assembly factor Coa1 family protein [Thermoanaerobaculia bacterium]